jgi:iron complex outermembrane receptor protein
MNLQKLMPTSLVALALLANLAKAQDQQAPAVPASDAGVSANKAETPKEKSGERVQVTGSRIKRIDAEGSTPVTVIGKEQIERTGATTVRDLLQGFSGTTAAFSGGGASVAGGVATVSLKGLGAARTLVLVDGVRLPKHPELAAVDLNSIPVAAIEKVEILRQSASAVYGADAVGGVINIITRKNYEGTQVQVQAKQPTRPGGESQSLNVTTGFNTDASNSVMILSYDQQNILIAKNRDFSRDRESPVGWPGTYSAQINGATQTFAVAGCPNYSETNDVPDRAAGCSFNYNDYNSLQPQVDRVSGLYNFTYNLPSDRTFTAKIMASHQNSTSRLRPEGSVGRDMVPLIDQSVIDAMSQERFNELFPGFQGTKPTSGGVRLNLRLKDFGYSEGQKEANLVGITTGLEGELASDWVWKVTANAAGTKTVSSSSNKFLIAPTNEALKKGELIPWASDFDVNALRERLVRSSYYVEESRTGGLEAQVSGEAGSLAGGPIGIAIGVSGQNESYNVDWNREAAEGLLLSVAGAPGEGHREVVSAFAEANIPLAKSFEASIAARLDNYSDFGSTFNPQLSLGYSPVDVLKFRSSVGTAFKAPSLVQMHGATGVSYNTVVDYTYCQANGISREDCPKNRIATAQVKNVRRSNKDLEPEKSDIYAFGFVIQPLQDLSLTADYWKIRSRDLIDYRNLQDLVDEGDPAVVRNEAEGVIEYIDLPIQNLSKTIRSGVDIGLDYKLRAPFALVNYQAIGTWYLEDKLTPTGKPEQNDLGTNGSYKWKLSNIIDVGFSEVYGLTLMSNTTGTHGKYADDKQRLPQYTRYDAQTRYKGTWNGEVALGVNNLLNTQGGVDSTNTGDVNSSIYDINGREYYLRVTQNL